MTDIEISGIIGASSSLPGWLACDPWGISGTTSGTSNVTAWLASDPWGISGSISGVSNCPALLGIDFQLATVVNQTGHAYGELPIIRAISSTIGGTATCGVTANVYPTKLLYATTIVSQPTSESTIYITEMGERSIYASMDESGRVITKSSPYVNEIGHLVIQVTSAPSGSGFRSIYAVVLRNIAHGIVRRGSL